MLTLDEKVKAIVALKQKHGIGSKQAWVCVEAEEAHSKLRERLIQMAQFKGVSYDPSVRDVSNLCKIARIRINGQLGRAAEREFISGESDNLPNVFDVVAFCPVIPKHFSQEGIKVNFDYDKFFEDFIECYWKTNETKKSILYATNRFRDSSHKYLSIIGEKLSLKEFSGRHNLLNSDTRPLDVYSARAELKSMREQIDDDYLNGEHLELLLCEGTEEERVLFASVPDKTSSYDRCLRDGTLMVLDVQRMIAIDTIKSVGHFINGKTASERIDAFVAYLKDGIERFGSSPIAAPGAVERNRYELLAVQNNRRWLEKELSK